MLTFHRPGITDAADMGWVRVRAMDSRNIAYVHDRMSEAFSTRCRIENFLEEKKDKFSGRKHAGCIVKHDGYTIAYVLYEKFKLEDPVDHHVINALSLLAFYTQSYDVKQNVSLKPMHIGEKAFKKILQWEKNVESMDVKSRKESTDFYQKIGFKLNPLADDPLQETVAMTIDNLAIQQWRNAIRHRGKRPDFKIT